MEMGLHKSRQMQIVFPNVSKAIRGPVVLPNCLSKVTQAFKLHCQHLYQLLLVKWHSFLLL